MDYLLRWEGLQEHGCVDNLCVFPYNLLSGLSLWTSVAKALKDPHTAARHMIVETEHPHFDTIQQPASSVRVGDAPVTFRRAPRRNKDAFYVLTELLDYAPERVEALRVPGAFGIA
jgi:crotonobetainyl-CoA:carnitine CoA-transferase CaiB-like acyl-CoA transferase